MTDSTTSASYRSPPLKVLCVFGTRPEAIKMAPLVLALKADARFACRLCVTAQHREMLDQVLALFGLVPDDDLDLMRAGQSLAGLSARALEALDAAALPALDPGRRLLLVTGHRRENFGDGFEQICAALATLAGRPDVQIVYPVNPNVQAPVRALLSGRPNVHLIEPQDYLPFVWLLKQCHLVLTDSGGLQEEAPVLGKPVLVMRETTERPEAIEAGTAALVGADCPRIVAAVNELLDDAAAYRRMAQAHNPYGDGTAALQITTALARWDRVAA